MAGEGFAVINTDDILPFYRSMADVFARVYKLHRIDAFRRARNRLYIFDTDLSLDMARAMKYALGLEHINSHIVPMKYLTGFGTSVKVNNANCLPQGFEVVRDQGKPLLVSWRDVAMLSFAQVMITEHLVMPRNSLEDIVAIPQRFGKDSLRIMPVYRPAPKPKATEYDLLDIFVGNIDDEDFYAHFRIRTEHFYFDYLGERAQPRSSDNLQIFMTDIEHYAPHVILTQRTIKHLNRQPLGRPFDDTHIFEEYSRRAVAHHRALTEGVVAGD